MDVQDAASLTIPEGSVRNIHDKNNQLLWSAVGYNVRYDGNTTQQTYSGKNLINVVETNKSVTSTGNVTSGTSGTYKSYLGIDDYVPCSPSTTYSVSFEHDIEGKTLTVGYRDANDNFISRTGYNAARSFTTPSNAAKMFFYIYDSSEPFSTIGGWVQEELGNQVTPYEPYVGGSPAPNPDYPQDVHVVTGKQTVQITGKNLVDFKISNMTINKASVTENNGIFTMTSTQAGISRVTIPVSADLVVGKTYELSLYARARVSNGANTYVKMREGASSGNWITSTPNSSIIPVSNDFVKCTLTFTTTVAKPYIWFYLSPIQTSTTLADIDVKDVQIEEGSYDTSYETYQGKTVNVDLRGKNLFDKSTIALGNNWNGAVGSTCYPFNSQLNRAVVLAPVEPNTWYTIRLYESNWYLMQTVEVNSAYTILNTRGGSQTGPDVTLNFKTTATTSYIGFKFKYGSAGTTDFTPSMLDELQLQIEEGDTATTYQPYHAPIELCKIGNYQDYIYKNGDDWYLHKELDSAKYDVAIVSIGQNGTTIGVNVQSYSGAFMIQSSSWDNAGGDYATTAANAIMSSGIGVYQAQQLSTNNAANSMVDGTFCQRYGTDDRIYFRNTGYVGKTGTEVKASLLANCGGTELYYYLTTPTDTKITDATLVAQLNAIHDWLTRYDYYGIVTGNLPIIINRSGII